MPALAVRLLPVFLFAAAASAHGGIYVPPQPPTPSAPPPGPTPSGPSTGGRYGGPGDTSPSGPGGGRVPSSPGPSGPSAPAPTGGSAPPPPPVTGGSSGPSAPVPGGPALPARGGATTPRGVTLEEDFDTWDHWWEFNKNGYLRLRDAQQAAAATTGSDDFYLGATRRSAARDTVRPTAAAARTIALPALKHALDAAVQRDITTACLVAIAKIGDDHPEFRLADTFLARLGASDQEVRETAALAFGIAAQGDERSLSLLAGLALDDATGRAARGGEVDQRTRAFAAYGLGLCAHRNAASGVQQRAFDVLRSLLDGGRASRDVRVAAIHALGLLDVDGRSHAAARLRAAALDALLGYFGRDLGGGDELVQAHCATSIARLVGRDPVLGARPKALFAAELRAASRRGHAIAQACALALGQMAGPHDGDGSADRAVSELLLATSKEHPERLTRHFALVALARIGGVANRAALCREFATAGKAQRKPWCALALGVLEHEHVRRHGGDADPFVVASLREAFDDAKDPGLVGACAVALGLCRATAHGDALRERLRADFAREQQAGYLCIGLALMEDRRAVDDLRAVLQIAERRPLLMTQAAVALGRLGDQQTVVDLLHWMTRGEPNLTKVAALSQAIAQIGDRRSLEPLIAMLHDTSLGALPRAFAAAAIGGVCDRLSLPWNTPIGADANYRAAVPTLTDQRTGVLDIL
jgi:hypothetical protein